MTPRFTKDLTALRKKDRKRYGKVTSIIMELGSGLDVSSHLRDDARIPKARKYGIDDSFRLLFQKVSGEDSFIALAVGKHDHVDSFLDGHKGWIFTPNGNLRELSVATATEQVTQVVPSRTVKEEIVLPAESNDEPPTSIFNEFSRNMFFNIGVPDEFIEQLWECCDPDALEATILLGEIAEKSEAAGDLLLVFLTGNEESKQEILQIAKGEAKYQRTLHSSQVKDVINNSEGLIMYQDPEELKTVLSKGTFEQWQLFLHPRQEALVTGSFNGPARVRGVSGSGKTVVGLHRAQYLAKRLIGSEHHVLYTTFNKALAESASSLLDTLCGEERAHIDVVHLHRWCLDSIKFITNRYPRWGCFFRC